MIWLMSAAIAAAAAPAAAQRRAPTPAPAVPAPAPASAPLVPSVRNGVELWKAGDFRAAVAMWQPFASAGDADAMFNIGQAYKLGRAVPKDSVQALSYYRRAAMKGHLPAQANLGILLFQAGEKPEAVRWLKAAADKNEMRAQYVLGVAHWNGDGLPRSLTLAYAYLSRASALGLPEATTALGNLTPMISPVERANGWAVSSSLAAGNGVPAEYARGTPPAILASVLPPADRPAPRAAEPPAPAPVRSTQPPAPPTPVATTPPPPRPAPVAVAEAAPRPAPVTVAQPAPPRPTPVTIAQATPPRPAPVAPQPVAEAQAPVTRTAERPIAPPVTTVAIPAAAPPAPPPPAPPPPATAPKPVAVAAAPSPRPVAKPTPKPSGWRVQLGAFAKRGQAEAAWSEMQAKQKAVVATTKPIYEVAGTVTKLQMGPFASKAAARDTCAKIAFSGRACFVTEG